MENNKTKKRRVIAIDFSKDKKRALRILEDEKKAREAIRRKTCIETQSKISNKTNFKAEVA